jgi:hypothetical protein
MYLAPCVGSDAAFLDAACQNFEEENHFVSDGEDKPGVAGEVDDATVGACSFGRSRNLRRDFRNF